MVLNNRIKWIDISRGIAIILMVVGHTSIPQSLSKFIWSFHMPLFFIVSGMMFNATKYSSLYVFVKHKTKTLVVPYLFFSTIVFCSYYGTEYWRPYEIYMGWTGYALWFIPVLFMGELVLFLFRGLNSRILIYTLFAILALVGWLLAFCSVKMPYKIDAVPFASIFILFGFYNKTLLLDYTPRYFKTILSFVVCLFFSQVLPKTGVGANSMGYVIPNIINAIVGSYMIFSISKHMTYHDSPCNVVLAWCGSNSIFIMAFSQILGYWILTGLNCFNIPGFIALPLRYALLFSSIWLIAGILTKYTPKLVGKWK